MSFTAGMVPRSSGVTCCRAPGAEEAGYRAAMATMSPRPGSVWCIVVAAGSGSRFGAREAVRASWAASGSSTGTGAPRRRCATAWWSWWPDAGTPNTPTSRSRCTVVGGATTVGVGPGAASRRCRDESTSSWCTTRRGRSRRRHCSDGSSPSVAGGCRRRGAGRPGDRHDPRRRRRGRRPGPVCGRCRPRRASGPPSCARAHAVGGDATDDAGLVEAAGGLVELVDGERTNLKLTTRDDLVIAEALLSLVRTEGSAS